MTITEKLDLAIKLKETGTTDGSYAVTYEKDDKKETLYRQTYMTNKVWNEFFSAMPKNAKKEYGEGGGDELSEKNGRPPKMASYGSSSRMIYNLSKNKENFHFEKKLPTSIGRGKANLDGFYEDDSRYIFVEAKCHEPYSVKGHTVSKAYERLYNYLNEHMFGELQIDMTTSKCGKYLNVEYFAGGEKLERFDIKQMICHLLGIATGLLEGTLKKKQVDFIYLLYDPTELDIDASAKAKINEIYDRTCYECNLIDFSELFREMLEFLIDAKFQDVVSSDIVDDMALKFTFTLASQDFYPILIS